MAKIKKIQVTDDKISGRGGLTFFLRYIENTGFITIATSILNVVNKSGKGLALIQFLKQIIANMIDGTDMSMSGFDRKKDDQGYMAVLENTADQMASSHQMKRFFAKMGVLPNKVYRRILRRLFIWRLKIDKPEIIILDVDTMVMDNNYSKTKQGCEPTYKKKKGFQPLHISWGPYLVDVLFRKGSAHSNHGTDFTDAVGEIVKLIRKKYRDVPIIIEGDSGFFDQKAFEYFEQKLNILYVITGKMYTKTKDYLSQLDDDQYKNYEQNGIWSYVELGNKLDSWSSFRRCIFTHLQADQNGQMIMEFSRPDSIYYTNIGMDKELSKKLIDAGGQKHMEAQGIIALAHQRGANELLHRSIKELATKEQLPFKNLGMNRAYYYLLVFAHFLFETYKRDITEEVLPITSYPNTFRRRLIDFAVKIVSHSGIIILKVARAAYDTLNIEAIWKRCNSPPVIAGW